MTIHVISHMFSYTIYRKSDGITLFFFSIEMHNSHCSVKMCVKNLNKKYKKNTKNFFSDLQILFTASLYIFISLSIIDLKSFNIIIFRKCINVKYLENALTLSCRPYDILTGVVT